MVIICFAVLSHPAQLGFSPQYELQANVCVEVLICMTCRVQKQTGADKIDSNQSQT
jgi:hypothetical protein